MRNRMMVIAGAVLMFAGTVGAQGGADLDLKGPDGAKLKATYYSAGKPGPGMILLHQCNMDRKSWATLASALAAKGVHVMTFDYRGYGESDERTDDREKMRTIREKWPGDIDVAFAALLAQPGVDKNRVAAGGASCGVNNSVQLARRSGQVKALMLLSGGTNEEGVAYLAQANTIPIFAATSQEETRNVDVLQRVVAASKGPGSQAKILTNAGHGVPMFTADSTLLPAIADWLAQALR